MKQYLSVTYVTQTISIKREATNWKLIKQYNRQKRTKKASSPVKHNNQLKDGDGQVKAHRKQEEAEKSSRKPLK